MTEKLSLEPPGNIEDPGELRFSRTQSYFDKSVTIKFLLAFVFALALFLFLHFRETYVPALELGETAKRHIAAPLDFTFPDEEATIIKREEAARQIGEIYRIDDSQISDQVAKFRKYLSSEEGKRKWNEISEKSDFQDVALALHLLSEGLFESGFTDMRTLQKIQELKPESVNNFYLFLVPTEGSDAPLPHEFWTRFEKETLLEKKVPEGVAGFLITYFGRVDWRFTRDPSLEYTIRKQIQSNVPEKLTHVYSGERLIDKGEKVTTRHLAMLKAMKDALAKRRNLLAPVTISGTLLITFLLTVMGAIYIRDNHPDILGSNRKLSLLITIILLTMILAKVIELIFINGPNNLIDVVRFPLFVPFAAILLSTLLNARVAAFGAVFLSIVFAMALAVESIPFLVINILTALVVLLPARMIRRRKEVFYICGKAWLAAIVVIVAFNLYENRIFTITTLTDLFSTFIFMAATAIIVAGLLPIFESTFQILTDITLMEYLDPTSDLLRRLTIEAPGTYQHSMVVGNLAEASASAIGANGLFCRVATQYHDVGKLANPQYFTENQLGGVDMHQLLTPIESAQVIIAHTSEGVVLARKAGLPEQFIDVIKEHHGTTLVYYFFHKQIELSGGDKNKVDPADFRYSGPKPRTKESSIIMIADTVEAAVRSLDSFTEECVTGLVGSLIAQKIEDGQFDDSLLTLEELGVVKKVLIKTLLAATHPRIKYPPHHHPGEEG